MQGCIASAIKKDKMKQKMVRMWRGGRVAADRQDDDIEGIVADPRNTSGEPHTERLSEINHPMEYMAFGGEIEDDSDFAEEPTPMVIKFHDALKRRPRRMRG